MRSRIPEDDKVLTAMEELLQTYHDEISELRSNVMTLEYEMNKMDEHLAYEHSQNEILRAKIKELEEHVAELSLTGSAFASD